MFYRSMPKAPEEKLSTFGFGCMRFPTLADGKIDEPGATKMIRHAVENGVNYFDTAYVYHNEESEPVVGRALKGKYRDKVNLATKLPTWLVDKASDFDKFLNEQLKRLQTDRIDYYLVHSLNRNLWDFVRPLKIFDWLRKAQADGRIRHIGFSFHDDLPVFKEIVDAFDWHFCQIQYNYMDEKFQAGTEGLEYAAARKLGIVVMEPLRGGGLAHTEAKEFNEIWLGTGCTPAAWALRWAWNRPEVSVVLSGVSNFEQTADNIVTASKYGRPGALGGGDLMRIARARNFFAGRRSIDCTACRYCMPCPFGVDIAGCFERYNSGLMFDFAQSTHDAYNYGLDESERASRCTSCGKCEALCPQFIKISDRLKDVAKVFGS